VLRQSDDDSGTLCLPDSAAATAFLPALLHGGNKDRSPSLNSLYLFSIVFTAVSGASLVCALLRAAAVAAWKRSRFPVVNTRLRFESHPFVANPLRALQIMSVPDSNPSLPGLVFINPVKYAQVLQKQTTGIGEPPRLLQFQTPNL
jgi:hypothetical protein